MKKDTAILMIHCPDQKGIVSTVTDFLLTNDGNIIDLDQHVDHSEQYFYMRVEWELDGFGIPQDKIAEFFETLIAKKYNMQWSIEFCHCVPRVAIFVSKYGHCLYDILARWESKEWDVEIPFIISNHDKFRKVAERHGIPFYHIPIIKDNKQEQEAKEIALLQEHNIDLILLARYMQIISENMVSKYKNKIINIHHSSLPAFAGADPYGNAFKRGVKFMGATAHYVTSDLDEGPIICQDVVPISHRDSIKDLKRKGKDIEKIVFAQAIWSHINHNVMTYNNKTVVFE